MKTLAKLATVAFLCLWTCHPATTTGTSWQTDQWDSGITLVPCTGWSVCGTFPAYLSGGSINDLQWTWTAPLTVGTTLSIPFEVVTTGTVSYQGSPNGATTDTPPYRVTLMLDHANDNSTDVNYRFYCTLPSGTYLLGTADNKPQVLSCPINWQDWTNVDGVTNQAGFLNTIGTLGNINLVFGGNGGLAHGLQVIGKATGEVGAPTIQ